MQQALATELLVGQRFHESCSVKQALAGDLEFTRLVITAADLMTDALHDGKTIFFFGNGGSAADAQHLAAELTGRYLRERAALAAVALTANTSVLTAIGNDYDYSSIFSRQIEALGRAGDVAVGISTSGTSANIVRGFVAAAEKGMRTIALTGKTGGQLKPLVECCFCVPTEETPRIQEAHILIGHILCELVERAC